MNEAIQLHGVALKACGSALWWHADISQRIIFKPGGNVNVKCNPIL